MTAIAASSVRVSTMSDGTLRLVVDIEPAFARDAFGLFCAPGTAVAIAALVPDHKRAPEPVSAPSEPVAEKVKGGSIAKWLGIRCNEPLFRDWLRFDSKRRIDSIEDAAEEVRKLCKVESRAEIDSSPEATERFHRLIRGPWAKWCIARGIASE